MKQWPKAGVLSLVFSLVPAIGCSRQVGELASSQNAAAGRQLPFDRVSDDKGISPTIKLVLPEIPAGTPITIHLQSLLSSAKSRLGDSFEAVLDEPVIIQGQTLVPRGTSVSGRIVAAKAAGESHDPGYLRLTLSSISINGRNLPLQSSSIFAKGSSREKRNPAMASARVDVGAPITEPAPGGKDAIVDTTMPEAQATQVGSRGNDIRFSTARRLTFRLVQPLSLRG